MALGAHMHPYSYMYYAPHRDGVLHCDSQPVSLGHQVFKTFAVYPSDRARVSRAKRRDTSFLFVFLFVFLFILEDFIGLLFMGIHNLFKVANEIMSSYCKA